VGLCAVLWSTSGLFIKLADANPFLIAGARSLIAALTMTALRLAFMHRPFAGLREALRTRGFWLAGLAYAVTMIAFVAANKLTASANAILLQYSAPAWAAIFGVLLIREVPHRENWLSLALVFAGLVVIFRRALAGGSLLGDAVALVSGVFFGLNSVAMRMQRNTDPAYGMILAHVLTTISGAFVILMAGAGAESSATGTLTAPLLLSLLFMGTVQVGLASALFAYGVRRVSAITALIIACVEPVLNPVWVLLVTGERPSADALAGGALIIAAVLLSSLLRTRSGQTD
jgi:drug/metabolite transporter (DMT)-like permease